MGCLRPPSRTTVMASAAASCVSAVLCMVCAPAAARTDGDAKHNKSQHDAREASSGALVAHATCSEPCLESGMCQSAQQKPSRCRHAPARPARRAQAAWPAASPRVAAGGALTRVFVVSVCPTASPCAPLAHLIDTLQDCAVLQRDAQLAGAAVRRGPLAGATFGGAPVAAAAPVARHGASAGAAVRATW